MSLPDEMTIGKAHPSLFGSMNELFYDILVDIHKDKPEETSIKSWTRFLRRNPFREDESTFLGLYHCHYRLNGKFRSQCLITDKKTDIY